MYKVIDSMAAGRVRVCTCAGIRTSTEALELHIDQATVPLNRASIARLRQLLSKAEAELDSAEKARFLEKNLNLPFANL